MIKKIKDIFEKQVVEMKKEMKKERERRERERAREKEEWEREKKESKESRRSRTGQRERERERAKKKEHENAAHLQFARPIILTASHSANPFPILIHHSSLALHSLPWSIVSEPRFHTLISFFSVIFPSFVLSDCVRTENSRVSNIHDWMENIHEAWH